MTDDKDDDDGWQVVRSKQKKKQEKQPARSGDGKPAAVVACKLERNAPIERGWPLGFDSKQQFDECMQEFRAACAASGIAVTAVGVRGTAATFESDNPNKPGHHFDKKGAKTSDIDAFVVTDTRLGARPNADGFFHPDKIGEEFPELKAWGQKWTGKLGREITPAAFKSTAQAMREPCIKV